MIAALTSQNTHGVTGVLPIEPAFVVEQLETVAADLRVDAVKIGMLGTAELVRAVGASLGGLRAPVVLDPVMVATSGDLLLAPDAVEALRELLPLVSLITPNLSEAAVLLDRPVAEDIAGMHDQARALAGLGAARVLVKGGHLTEAAVDVFYADGRATELSARRVETRNTHGTGCSLSSAIAAFRARGADWLDAVGSAKTWLTAAIEAADSLDVGFGRGPIHHFHQWWH